jgi:hypothetical protein
MGGRGISDGITGYLDEVMMWDEALSAGEIADLYNPAPPGVVGDIFPVPGDDIVDGDDLGVLLANWGTVAAGNSADLFPIGGNLLVDGDDLGVLLANWTPPAITAGGAAVPEPASFTLLLLGALAMLGIYRKR